MVRYVLAYVSCAAQDVLRRGTYLLRRKCLHRALPDLVAAVRSEDNIALEHLLPPHDPHSNLLSSDLLLHVSLTVRV
jgi:hypothetical protein